MKGLYVTTLIVLAMLGGQVLSFSDDGAASGAATAQETEPETAIAGAETASAGDFEPEQVSEAPDGDENASEGD